MFVTLLTVMIVQSVALPMEPHHKKREPKAARRRHKEKGGEEEDFSRKDQWHKTLVSGFFVEDI